MSVLLIQPQGENIDIRAGNQRQSPCPYWYYEIIGFWLFWTSALRHFLICRAHFNTSVARVMYFSAQNKRRCRTHKILYGGHYWLLSRIISHYHLAAPLTIVRHYRCFRKFEAHRVIYIQMASLFSLLAIIVAHFHRYVITISNHVILLSIYFYFGHLIMDYFAPLSRKFGFGNKYFDNTLAASTWSAARRISKVYRLYYFHISSQILLWLDLWRYYALRRYAYRDYGAPALNKRRPISGAR